MTLLLQEALAQVVRLEVSTNNLLMALLGEEETKELFFGNLQRLAGRSLVKGVLKREHHVPPSQEGLRKSQHDFAILDDEKQLIGSIETKISASVTSDDQISRYVADLAPGGALFVVTPSYGYNSMRAEIDKQLGQGAGRSVIASGATRWEADEDKIVCLLRWSECLDFAGATEALVALSRAIEGAWTSWRPFAAGDMSPDRGQVVVQIAKTARALLEDLDDLCLQRDWPTQMWDSASNGMGRTINILGHGVEVGFMPELWRVDPQLQYADDPRGSLMPSPLWLTRAEVGTSLPKGEKGPPTEPRVQTTQAFNWLGKIRAARPLLVALEAPEQVVIDALVIDARAALGHVHDLLPNPIEDPSQFNNAAEVLARALCEPIDG